MELRSGSIIAEGRFADVYTGKEAGKVGSRSVGGGRGMECVRCGQAGTAVRSVQGKSAISQNHISITPSAGK